jgi:hypothetical protein
MNEKRSVNAADSFSIKPPAFSSRVRAILASPGQHPSSLEARLDEMAALIAGTHSLVEDVTFHAAFSVATWAKHRTNAHVTIRNNPDAATISPARYNFRNV